MISFNHINPKDLVSNNVNVVDPDCGRNNDSIGNNSFGFDIRYQKNFSSAQPIKVNFNFS